jgi:hypothetical protein
MDRSSGTVARPTPTFEQVHDGGDHDGVVEAGPIVMHFKPAQSRVLP